MRTYRHTGNWFSDDSSGPDAVNSLFKRLDRRGPLRVANYARSTATVPSNLSTPLLKSLLGEVDDMPRQVDHILERRHFPNLILSWIGHNNVDWKYDLDQDPSLDADTHCAQIPGEVAEAYRVQIARLVAKARQQSYPVAIVIYGLGDVRSAFASRDQAEAIHQKNPGAYPDIDVIYAGFPSLRPEYRSQVPGICDAINEALQAMAASWPAESNVRVVYSDALSRVPIQLSMLSPRDGWHFNPVGHEIIAAAAQQSLTEILPGLGATPGVECHR
jgi:lysophospholipase L1-like esterase